MMYISGLALDYFGSCSIQAEANACSFSFQFSQPVLVKLGLTEQELPGFVCGEGLVVISTRLITTEGLHYVDYFPTFLSTPFV